MTTQAQVERFVERELERLEGKIDILLKDHGELTEQIGQILAAFEELGNQFEGAVSGFLEGPMGKLMGKLMGKPKEEVVESSGDG